MALVLEIKDTNTVSKPGDKPQYVFDMRSVEQFITAQYRYMSGKGHAPGTADVFNARSRLRTTPNINFAERFGNGDRLRVAGLAKQLEMIGVKAEIVTDTALPIKALRWFAETVRVG
jgi:hypothetical protein